MGDDQDRATALPLNRRSLGGLGLGWLLSPAAAQGAGLGSLARTHGVVFGTAIQARYLEQDAAYRDAVATEASLLVPEWEAKWAALQPEEGRFDTAPLDAILAWARSQRIPVRGHALVWHNAMPDWLPAALAEGRQRALGVLAAHLDVALHHARGQIRDWDVVNEPIANPPGSDVPDPGPGPLRDTPWLRALGPSYVETALRMARERDPTLRLTLNEYGVEEDTPDAAEKRRRLLALLRDLVGRGVPLDAVGIQAHLQLARPFRPEPFAAFLKQIRSLGLTVLVTELDIRETHAAPQDLARRDALVAERAEAFLACAVQGGARTVLSWGLTDRYSWLATEPAVALPNGRVHRGLPLDADYHRKPMWNGMARAFARG